MKRVSNGIDRAFFNANLRYSSWLFNVKDTALRVCDRKLTIYRNSRGLSLFKYAPVKEPGARDGGEPGARDGGEPGARDVGEPGARDSGDGTGG